MQMYKINKFPDIYNIAFSFISLCIIELQDVLPIIWT